MAGKKTEKTQAEVQSTAPEPQFSKERLLASKKFATRRDLLSVLLEDGKTYTTAEVKALLETFMKGKVK